ncbi:nucleotidyltransferase family protein [Pannus brasiliensis CCIBt3594]|uniref:Nucleotidyltransferase family protein n=1 Tax=Pannus brasiliensis CCIBt3594 TaxID=1427578 RepID=A0AAW9QRR2_9CHRO
MSRPEIELLLNCARTTIDAGTEERIRRSIRENIDWIYLLQTAARHGILPLLSHSLQATCPESVPEPLRIQLSDHFQNTVARNSFLTKELLKILKLFESHGMLAIPFKGPVLATSVYGNLALRQFGDLDLLVNPRDILTAKKLLLSRGYHQQQDIGWECHFVDREGRINVDLHRAIVPDHFNLRLEFDRSRLVPLFIEDARVWTIPPEELLLLLAVQLGKDCCHWKVRLIQLCDSAELIRAYPKLDWARVRDRAIESGCERMLSLNLSLIHQLFGTSLPETVLETIKADPAIESLAHHIHSRLWQEPDELPDEPSLWSFFWSYNHRFYWQMRERPRDRWIYCLHWLKVCTRAAFLPNEVDDRRFRFPKTLSFLSYPLHLARLLLKHGRRIPRALLTNLLPEKPVK